MTDFKKIGNITSRSDDGMLKLKDEETGDEVWLDPQEAKAMCGILMAYLKEAKAAKVRGTVTTGGGDVDS